MPRLLVIDDEQYIREWYDYEFSLDGYDVATNASCRNLIKKIGMFKPDVIILDIKLADCNGLDALQEIRARYPDLCVIICSAYDSYKDSIKALAADYYVVKSFDLTELKSKVERALAARIPFLSLAG